MGLQPFEGHETLGTRIKITRAGDGLSKALAVEPVELRMGGLVYVVLQCEVGKIEFEPIKDTDGVSRVQVLRAGTATIVDADLVSDLLAEQQAKIDEANGVTRLDFDGGADDNES